jgi:hypothetical protein
MKNQIALFGEFMAYLGTFMFIVPPSDLDPTGTDISLSQRVENKKGGSLEVK